MSETSSRRSFEAGSADALAAGRDASVHRPARRLVANLLRSGALVARLTLVYAAGCLLGLALLVGSFRAGLFAGIDILFYRGLLATAAAALVTFGLLATAMDRLRRRDLGLRDAFAAAAISAAFNLSFLVVVPVTADRSISIFLLGAMALHPATAMTPDMASTLFKQVYVDDFRQIDRRLREQWTSGNLDKIGDGYRISARGRRVVEVAKLSAWLFDSHAGLLDPRATDRHRGEHPARRGAASTP